MHRYLSFGPIRSVFSYDIDEDGEVEILAATRGRCIHILNSQGEPKGELSTDYRVYVLFVTQLMGRITLLASTSNKSLKAWTIKKQKQDQSLLFQEQWSLSPQNSVVENHIHAIYVGDINGDGLNEILLGAGDKHLYIMDQEGKPLWKHSLRSCVSSIYAVDIDLDGITEVLVGMEDNQIQALRLQLDKNETLYTDILSLYDQTKQLSVDVTQDFSLAERQLLRNLVREERPLPTDYHKEWAVVNLLMEQHHYEQALPLLLRLLRQRVQHFWSQPIRGLGRIRMITSGEVTNDDVYGVLCGTEEGDVKAIDIIASKGRQVWSTSFDEGIVKVETQKVSSTERDIVLVVSDNQSVSILDSKGNRLRELVFENEHDRVYTLYVHKEENRKYDAISDVIIGLANKKIYIYDGALQQQIAILHTQQGNKVICTYDLNNSGEQQIITASPDNCVYVYTREGEKRWQYDDIDGQVRALCARDIDGDGHAEVIAGSEDRNVYVLDYQGHLKWRYRTPHRVLAVAATDVDGDGSVEVLIGCEDSYMYVLSGEGDLLWKYKANDRVTAIHVQDLHINDHNGDNRIEIALGSEDVLELLQVLDREEIIERINLCWKRSLDSSNRRRSIFQFMEHENEDMRTLALAKLAGQIDKKHTEEELKLFQNTLEENSLEAKLEDEALEVRKELVRMAAVLDNFHSEDPKSMQMVRRLLQQLSIDPRQEIKLAIIEWLPRFRSMAICFEYLDRFIQNIDLWVRRSVVRQLDKLIERYPEQVFPRLLRASKDKDKWILQETGRSLARYFAVHQAKLFSGIQELLAYGINPLIIRQMAYSSPEPNKTLFIAIAKMLPLAELGEAEVEEILNEVVHILQEMSTLKLSGGEGTLQKYTELRQLFRVKIIDDIEQYQWIGNLDLIADVSGNTQILRVFPGLSQVIETIKRYRKRQTVGDRLAGLIEANNVLTDLKNRIYVLEDQRVQKDPKGAYTVHSKCPPEDHILESILQRWIRIIFTEVQHVRGKAKLYMELKGKHIQQEEMVVVSLEISNTGRSPAENVHVRLEEGSGFEIVRDHAIFLNEITTHSPIKLDFSIRPSIQSLRLAFDITYDDAEETGKTLEFAETLELQTSHRPFKKIPNPYRTGNPLRENESDRRMFFGRQEDLQFLQDKLTNPDANNTVVLSGQRRSGKTSLLYRFMGDLASLDQHVAVLIDLQELAPATNAQQLLRGFAQCILTTFKNRGIPAPALDTFDFGQDPMSTFTLFLEHILSSLLNKTLILLIDEFETLDDKVRKGEISPDFLKYLRSLMQHRQGIAFLFAGAPKIRHMTDSYWAVFFNTTLPYTLSKFNVKDAEELITKPVAGYLEYDELALEKIHRLTGDQPYLIHIMSETLIRSCNKKKKSYVTVNDVNTVCDQVIGREDHFVWIWNQEHQSTTKHFILSILAQEKGEEGRIFSLADIKDGFEAQGRRFERDVITKALNDLAEEGFVEQYSDGIQFRIPVGLMRAWLRRVKPPERVVREEPLDGDQRSS